MNLNQRLIDLPGPPWALASMGKLRDLLAQAYSSKARVRVLAESAGVDLGHWNSDQAPVPAWNDLLVVTMAQGKLGQLFDQILADSNVRAYHEQLQGFRELRIAAAPENRGDGDAPTSASTSLVHGWILVAGSGKTDALSPPMAEACNQLGAALAAGGFGLLTGGWPGVDRAVAAAFAEGLRAHGRAAERHLLQIVEKSSSPAYVGGDIIFVDGDDRVTSIAWADAVVLLGGVGGTLRIARMALEKGKLVLPIADTGGDAKKLYMELIREAQHRQAADVQGVPYEDFLLLGRPASMSVVSALELVKRHALDRGPGHDAG